MVKKQLIPFAQVIESGLVIRSPDKPVLWAFTPAGKEEPAFPAESRKAILLLLAKLPLPRRRSSVYDPETNFFVLIFIDNLPEVE